MLKIETNRTLCIYDSHNYSLWYCEQYLHLLSVDINLEFMFMYICTMIQATVMLFI
jgi:hypothetical protein